MPYTYPVSSVPASSGPTPSQTVGPFFHTALPFDSGPSVVGAERPGAVTLRGHVYDGQGDPVPDALVEVWQADETGSFRDEPGVLSEVAPDGFRGFGRCPTDETGAFGFTTVVPGAVPTRDGTRQAPHVAMSVFARGMLRRVVTRVYFAPSADDPLLASLPDDRVRTLVAVADDDGYRFDVQLQGPDETVFLDVVDR
jgi:protocatechuate 3,4-dioxygenase alpha subunit